MKNQVKLFLTSLMLLVIASGARADVFSNLYSAVTIRVDKSDCPSDEYRAVAEHIKGERLNWVPSECTGVFVEEFFDNEDNTPDGNLAAFIIRWANHPTTTGIVPKVTLNLDELDQNDGMLYIESRSPVSLPIRLSSGDGPYALLTGIDTKRFPYGVNNPDGVNTLSVGVNLGPLQADPEDRFGAEERLLDALGSGQLESAPIIIRKRKN